MALLRSWSICPDWAVAVFCELSFILIGSGFAVLNPPFSLAVAFEFSKCVSVTTVLLKCVCQVLFVSQCIFTSLTVNFHSSLTDPKLRWKDSGLFTEGMMVLQSESKQSMLLQRMTLEEIDIRQTNKNKKS